MSETMLIAEKMTIYHHLSALRTKASELEARLLKLPDLYLRTSALMPTGKIGKSDAWEIAEPDDIRRNLKIFSKFTYDEDQDPREAKKFPAVIQLHPNQHADIAELIQSINEDKDALAKSNAQLKKMLGKKSSEVWQSVQTFSSIIQILRHISVIQDNVHYLGLSFMVKPVVTRMDKKAALSYIDEKISFCENRSSFIGKLSFLDEIRQQVADVDERRFEIKMARQGAPRFMLNAKSGREDYQVMASMPVFVFADEQISVSFPSKKSRKSRADKRIPLGEIKSEFGIYLIPKKSSIPQEPA